MGCTKYQYLQMPEKDRRTAALTSADKKLQVYAAQDPAESVRIALLLNPSTKKNTRALSSILRKEQIQSIRIRAENMLLDEKLYGNGDVAHVAAH